MKLAIDRKFNLKENLDVLVAFGVIGIVLMIIIPLPSIALDIYLIDFILMIMRIEIPNSKKAYLLSLVF